LSASAELLVLNFSGSAARIMSLWPWWPLISSRTAVDRGCIYRITTTTAHIVSGMSKADNVVCCARQCNAAVERRQTSTTTSGDDEHVYSFDKLKQAVCSAIPAELLLLLLRCVQPQQLQLFTRHIADCTQFVYRRQIAICAPAAPPLLPRRRSTQRLCLAGFMYPQTYMFICL